MTARLCLGGEYLFLTGVDSKPSLLTQISRSAGRGSRGGSAGGPPELSAAREAAHVVAERDEGIFSQRAQVREEGWVERAEYAWLMRGGMGRGHRARSECRDLHDDTIATAPFHPLPPIHPRTMPTVKAIIHHDPNTPWQTVADPFPGKRRRAKAAMRLDGALEAAAEAEAPAPDKGASTSRKKAVHRLARDR